MTQAVEREIQFRPAFHRCHPNPSQNYGVGSVNMLWILRRDGWAMTWDVHTGWDLPADAFDAAAPDCPRGHGTLGTRPATGGAVDWHSPWPLFDDQELMQSHCAWLDGPCYMDSGFLLGDELFDLLRTDGHEAVWARLGELLDERRAEVLAEQVAP